MKYLLFSIFYIFLIACSGQNQKGQTVCDLQTISIKEGEIEKLTDADVLNSIHFVPLETTDSCLVGGEIKQLEIFEGKIFLLDMNAQIFAFNCSGKFLQRIGKRGPGPEEYVNATHLYIDPFQKCICIYDASTSYIINNA